MDICVKLGEGRQEGNNELHKQTVPQGWSENTALLRARN